MNLSECHHLGPSPASQLSGALKKAEHTLEQVTSTEGAERT